MAAQRDPLAAITTNSRRSQRTSDKSWPSGARLGSTHRRLLRTRVFDGSSFESQDHLPERKRTMLVDRALYVGLVSDESPTLHHQLIAFE
jgi:hypothetical protein